MQNNNPIETWTREQCEEYLKQYPKSLKSEAVRKRRDALQKIANEENRKRKDTEEDKFWQDHSCDIDGIVEYMKKYPHGRYINECDNVFWSLIDGEWDVEEYMKRFPTGKHILECDDAYWSFVAEMQEGFSYLSAKRYIELFKKGKHIRECDDVIWKASKDSTSGINEYKREFPQGEHAKEIDTELERAEKKEISNSILPMIGMLLCLAAIVAIIWVAVKFKCWELLVIIGPIVWVGNKLNDKLK